MAAASLDRATFDWAAFAFSTRPVLALPSTFVASAVCMFRPAAARFDVYARPANATGGPPLRCHRPIVSAWGAHAHACKVDAEYGATWVHAGLPTPASQRAEAAACWPPRSNRGRWVPPPLLVTARGRRSSRAGRGATGDKSAR